MNKVSTIKGSRRKLNSRKCIKEEKTTTKKEKSKASGYTKTVQARVDNSGNKLKSRVYNQTRGNTQEMTE